MYLQNTQTESMQATLTYKAQQISTHPRASRGTVTITTQIHTECKRNRLQGRPWAHPAQAGNGSHFAGGEHNDTCAGCSRKLPLNNPALSSRRAPATKDVHNKVEDLWPPEDHNICPNSWGIIAKTQTTYSSHSTKARCASPLEPFNASKFKVRSARAPLLCCTCRTASHWLDTLLLTRALELKSWEVWTTASNTASACYPPSPPKYNALVGQP
jgi:hypothetical protein